MALLTVENATMQFGGVVAVNNLNLEIEEHKITSLIGPNGAGKTTAFNLITGVYQPTNGVVKFKDKEIVRNHPTGKMKKNYAGINGDKYLDKSPIDPSPDEITEMGIARTFQNIRLFKSMTVFDNVLIAMHLRKKAGLFTAISGRNAAEEAMQRDKVMELLELVGLADNKDELATSLPYGKQRRLEIVRALATEPELLLLDEPAAGMNPQETLDLGDFIVKIKEKFNLTIFMIEHHMDLVMKFSDKIYAIDFGSLICEGTPEKVASDPKVIEAYLGVSDDE